MQGITDGCFTQPQFKAFVTSHRQLAVAKSGSHQGACHMRYQCPLSPPPAADQTLTSCHPVQFLITVITSLASSAIKMT